MCVHVSVTTFIFLIHEGDRHFIAVYKRFFMALSLFRKAVNLSPNRLVIPKECGTAHKCPAIISLVCRENLSENFVCVQNVNYDDGEEETSIYFKTNEQVQIYT